MIEVINKDRVITPLISEERIQARVAELGSEISEYCRKNCIHRLVVICVLKGAFVFCADLIRKLDIPEIECDLMAVSSYPGGRTKSSGAVELKLDLSMSIVGEHVLLVEDIADTRLTLSYLLAYLRRRDPKSLQVCAFLNKPSRAEVKVPINFTGFSIENKFVVGYGLDFDQRFRNLPYIGFLEE